MEQWKEYKETEFGKIPNSWDVATIKEETKVVVDYVANGSFASLAENVKYKTEEDYAVLIRLVDYKNNYNGNFVFIDKEAYEFLGKSKLFGDEIIISNVGANVGTVFKCPRLKYKMSLAPNSIMVKFKGNNDFYYYWLKSPFGQHMLHSIVTGSDQPKFNKTNFREMSIPVPPIEIQEKIAQLLKPLDEKIEVNKQINSNLECSTSNSPDISLGSSVSRTAISFLLLVRVFIISFRMGANIIFALLKIGVDGTTTLAL